MHSPPDGLAYFYCGHHDPSVSTSSRFLIHTILHLLRCCPDGFKQMSEDMPKHDGKLTQSDHLALARSMLRLFRNVYIVIDALDESDDFEAMIRLFTDLLSCNSHREGVRIVLTSREEIDIEKALEPLSPIRMSTFGNVANDIHSFIVSEVEERMIRKTLKLRDGGLRETIQRSIFEAAGGMYVPRAVSCNR